MDNQYLADEISILKAQVAAQSYTPSAPSWEQVRNLEKQVQTLAGKMTYFERQGHVTKDDLKSALSTLRADLNRIRKDDGEQLTVMLAKTISKVLQDEREKTSADIRATASVAAESAREARTIAANELESALSTIKSFSYTFANARSA